MNETVSGIDMISFMLQYYGVVNNFKNMLETGWVDFFISWPSQGKTDKPFFNGES